MLELWSGYGRRKLSSLLNPLSMATLRRRLHRRPLRALEMSLQAARPYLQLLRSLRFHHDDGGSGRWLVRWERGLPVGVRKVERIPKRRTRTKRWAARISCLPLPLPTLLPPIPMPSPPLPGWMHRTRPHFQSATSSAIGPRLIQLFPHQARRTELPLRRSRRLLPMRTITSIQTKQSPMHPTPPHRPLMKSPLLHHHPKLPHRCSQRRIPLLPKRVHRRSKITCRHLLHTPFRSP